VRATAVSKEIATTRLLKQIGGVLDPIAENLAGSTAQALIPVIQQAWRAEFRTELGEPTLSRCAAALAAKRHWSCAMGHRRALTGWPAAGQPSRRTTGGCPRTLTML
jgi:hypothetical protein